jgi:ubiquitin carboxyl-terminal hydrolase 9/13
MLCARNKFFCDTCSSLQEAEKRMKVKKLPNVLALHLKRFKYEEALQRFVKLAYRVVFPFEMRLFNTSDDAEEPDKLYELFAIIVHLGTGPHQGHYISIVRVGIRWFVFDDETVTIIDEADIARYFGDTPGAGSAYVLFYQAVELDMERLGLVDAAVERQKAKEKKEEEAWIQYKMGQSPLPETTAIKEVPPRLFSTSPAPMQNSAIPNDIPITPTTPQPAHARQQNTLSSLSSQTTNDLAESKSSSWFSSLRPGSGRKPSTNNHLMGSGQSHGLPIPLKYGTGQGDDVDAASISTSNSSRQAHKEAFEVSPLHKGVPAGDASSPESTIALSNTSYSPSKMVKQPSQGAGAAFAPAGRTLSKKEQEMIAKQSRRASLTASPAVQQLNNGTLTSPNQDTAAVTSSTGQPLWEGRKPLIRRPSTAEPQTIMPRRKTLSSKFSFGLGKKADKS